MRSLMTDQTLALKLMISQLKQRHLEILKVDHQVIQWIQMTTLWLVIPSMVYMLVRLGWTKFLVKRPRTMRSSCLRSFSAGRKLGQPVLKGKVTNWNSWTWTAWMHKENAQRNSFLMKQSSGQKLRLPSIASAEWWEMDGHNKCAEYQNAAWNYIVRHQLKAKCWQSYCLNQIIWSTCIMDHKYIAVLMF